MHLLEDEISYRLPNGNGFAAHLDAMAYDYNGKISTMGD